ncbi:MAG TPA: hypothetical protein VMB20_02955 [Candidatus Acidoferrum sp.]|nr:hypothetical protein [Candidatus Acidoferrum sp.]
MSQTTLYLAKLFGLFLLILGISMLVQRQNTIAIWIALVHNLPLIYVVSLVTIAAGLAVVLAHNRWRGGAPPVVVTLLGWVTLLKGVSALVLPADLAMQAFALLSYDRYFYIYTCIWLVLGAYLTVAGFRLVPVVPRRT